MNAKAQPDQTMTLSESVFIRFQQLLPKTLITRLMGLIGNSTCPLIKTPMIHGFKWYYKVDLSLAQYQSPSQYPSFNAFFTRALKPEARPVACHPNQWLSPCDGTLVFQGPIDSPDQSPLGNTLIKGHSFSLSSLLAAQQPLIERFSQGHMSIIYLAPKDYHRVHMPVTGKLLSMTYVPGSFYSVNDVTVRNIPGIFARNERIICTFETQHGLVALILVGALIVGSIETTWAGVISPRSQALQSIYYDQKFKTQFDDITLKQGQEMGRFLMGSTVIMLSEQQLNWHSNLTSNDSVQMGQPLANWP